MAKEVGIDLNNVVKELFKSEHGDLKSYVPVVLSCAKERPDFLAHLIAYNQINGQIRDSKVALPVISLKAGEVFDNFIDNSLAHLALLSPKDLLRACYFVKDIRISPNTKIFNNFVERYLRVREVNKGWFNNTALHFRNHLKGLYALNHIKPNTYADKILFKKKYPKNSVFETIKNLKSLPAKEVASAIINEKIPFLVAINALGENKKNVDVLLAIVESMSPTELVTNSKMLEKLGVFNNPILKSSYESGLGKVKKSTRSVLKSDKAIEAVSDEKIKQKLKNTQEKQLKQLGGIDGNWLVLGDKSGSMSLSVDIAKDIAGILAKMVKGKVHLVFFDNKPYYYDVTGKTYEEIKTITRNVKAGGRTSISCGLDYILQKNKEVDGIAIVSDGEDNYPAMFGSIYKKYSDKIGKEPTVYFYRVSGGINNLSKTLEHSNIPFEEFDLRNTKVDYYSLPNIIQTMNVNKYNLIDTIMETPLLTLNSIQGYAKNL